MLEPISFFFTFATNTKHNLDMKYLESFCMLLMAMAFYASNACAQNFERVTNLDDLKAGDELLLVYEGSNGMNLALGPRNTKDTYRLGKNVKIQNDVISDVGEAHTIRLVGEKGNWSLYDILDGTYLAFDGTNALVSKTNILSDYCKWSIYVEDLNGKNITRIQNKGSQNYYLIKVASYNLTIFGCYTISSNIYSTSIFRKVIPPVENVTLTMGTVGYATLYYGDRALVVPEGVTAHTMRVENDQLVWSKTYTAGATIPQATGVVLKGQQGSYTFKVSQDEGEADAANMLKGTDEAATTTGGDSYFFLSPAPDNAENVGFFWGADNGGAFTNGAHKAYLAVPQGSSAKRTRGYALSSHTTGVDAIAAKQETAASDDTQLLVNLWGQHVSSGYKGIVIKNGKKYILK